MTAPTEMAHSSKDVNDDKLDNESGKNSSDRLHDDQPAMACDAAGDDYFRVRQLLLGEDYTAAIERYLSREDDVDRIAEALPEAINQSIQHNLPVGKALAPVVNKAIETSIENNPGSITNILFPIMGPAIRKAVASALAEMVQTLNTLLEQSLTLGSLNWRIRAWRAGIPYAQYLLLHTIEYRVEQVLLVHKQTGLLLNSVSAPEIASQDPELVSSMLTAISDFVSDSFSDGKDKETLERIRFGDLELLLVVGPQAILAVAVRGSAPDSLSLKANHTIEKIHADYANVLIHFDGDRAPFEDTNAILASCLRSQKAKAGTKRKPWLAITLLSVVSLYYASMKLDQYRLHQIFDDIEQALSIEPGYLVLSTQRRDQDIDVKLLRSPESRTTEWISQINDQVQNTDIDINIEDTVVHFGPVPAPALIPPVSLPHSAINLQAITNSLLQPGEYITVVDQGSELSISGEMSQATVQRIQDNPILNKSYSEIDVSQVLVSNISGRIKQLERLVARIQNTVFYFDPNEASLSERELSKVPGFIQQIAQLDALSVDLDITMLQIMLIGFADSMGSNNRNRIISQQRADTIKSLLTENNISADILVAWGVGNADSTLVSERSQRRVAVQILYEPLSRGKAGAEL